MPLEIKQLRYAVLAADTRSFASAASMLSIKQATLSRRIATLEHRLGVKLFERTTRGSLPTPAGEAFVDSARRILHEIDALHASVKALGAGEAGDLTVGFCTPLASGNLRFAFVEFMRRYPNVYLHGVERDRCRLFHDLQAGIIDLAVITGEIPDTRLQRRPLWSEKIMVAMPQGHPMATAERIFWSDLREETFILTTQDPGPDLADLLRARLAEPGRAIRVLMQDVSRENVLNMVSAAGFLTLVPEASLGAVHGDVVLREIRDLLGQSHIDYDAYWRGDNQSPALRRFLKLLSDRFPAARPQQMEAGSINGDARVAAFPINSIAAP